MPQTSDEKAFSSDTDQSKSQSEATDQGTVTRVSESKKEDSMGLLKPAGDSDIIRRLSSVSSLSGPGGETISIGSKKNSMIDMIVAGTPIRRKSSSIFGSSYFDSDRRDSSPNRLKKAVADLASKTKKVMSRKSGIHLDVPKVEFGMHSRDFSPSDVVSARGRRPSIAAVPVMLDASDDSKESDSEEEEEMTSGSNNGHHEKPDSHWIVPPENSE